MKSWNPTTWFKSLPLLDRVPSALVVAGIWLGAALTAVGGALIFRSSTAAEAQLAMATDRAKAFEAVRVAQRPFTPDEYAALAESLSLRFPGVQVSALPEKKPARVLVSVKRTEDYPVFEMALASLTLSGDRTRFTAETLCTGAANCEGGAFSASIKAHVYSVPLVPGASGIEGAIASR